MWWPFQHKHNYSLLGTHIGESIYIEGISYQTLIYIWLCLDCRNFLIKYDDITITGVLPKDIIYEKKYLLEKYIPERHHNIVLFLHI